MEVNGKTFVVQVNEGGDIEGLKPIGDATICESTPVPAGEGDPQGAPLAGNIFKVLINPGQAVEEGEVVMILEAMKMETEICAFRRGVIGSVNFKVGDAVSVGDSLLTIS